MAGAVIVTLPIAARPVSGSDASAADAVPVVVASAYRPVPPLPARPAFWSLISLLILSALVHSTLLWVFVQAPQELPSIGIPAISVEIVVGDDTPAGLAAAAGQEGAPQTKQEVMRPAAESADVSRSAPPPQLAEETVPPDAATPMNETAVASERKHAASTAPEAPRAMSEPEPVLREARPSALDFEATPVPPPAADLPEPEPAKPAKADEPPKPEAKPAPLASPPSPSANGIGRGGSAADANYAARVAAHLARHKQFPADARRRGQQGSASISFSIDGDGRVTEIKLTRSAGAASLDREAQAMVRRASPFPPPPAGRSQSFTVPLSFSMR
jgi:protein TonB